MATKNLSEEELLNLLISSDIDESDDDIVDTFEKPKKIREGVQKMSMVEEINLLETESDNINDDTDNIPIQENMPEVNNNIKFTSKENIKWRNKPFDLQIDYKEKLKKDYDLEESTVNSNPLLPIEYFQKYITKELCENAAYYTNLYATQRSTTDGSKFKPTDANEIENLFGLHILMGTLKYPRIRLYWQQNFKIDLVKNTMNVNRFYCLRQNLHFVNNLEIENENDKLTKVRPIYESVLNRCLELPREKFLCVDEQMIPFKGKFSIKQFMKDKPNRWGIKIFLLCGQSGLVHNFIIYQGQTTEISKEIQQKYGFGAAVVLHLIQNVEPISSGQFITFDNFFTTYQLLETLKQRNFLAIGTARINRFHNPPFTESKIFRKKERGSFEEVVDLNKDVVLLKWNDNKEVYLASNFIGVGEIDEVERWDKIKKRYININRPESVKLYNETMGGVDKFDQLMSFYRIFIKSKKWPPRVITHALDMAICNSWLEYKNDCRVAKISPKEIMDLMMFRMRLAEELIVLNKPVQTIKRGRPSSSSPSSTPKRKETEVQPYVEISKDNIGHYPDYDTNGGGTRCKYQNCGKKTFVYCEKCKIHLCFVPKTRNCFKLYHCGN